MLYAYLYLYIKCIKFFEFHLTNFTLRKLTLTGPPEGKILKTAYLVGPSGAGTAHRPQAVVQFG